ncbi:MAG: GT-D fold domain-containing protein [Oscillospiraceae bacterium]|jgi:glycosyltransferase family protein|nr:GT-D fold domain-containing protein [Oscillospiraceae bacterium]
MNRCISFLKRAASFCLRRLRGLLVRREVLLGAWANALHLNPRCCPREETLGKIAAGASIARFGDGEQLLISTSLSLGFQPHDRLLAKRLRQVLRSRVPGLLVGIPTYFQHDMPTYAAFAQDWIAQHLRRFRWQWVRQTRCRRRYDNAHVTRPYIDIQDKAEAARLFGLWKALFAGRDLVLLEGAQTRMGVGNDLFDAAKSVQRILCPAENAWSHYQKIFAEAKKSEPGALILIALGPTATVLAYDLHLAGHQAIDIGHIDIEYEWFLRGAVNRITIPGKYVNEAPGGSAVKICDDPVYLSQVIARI